MRRTRPRVPKWERWNCVPHEVPQLRNAAEDGRHMGGPSGGNPLLPLLVHRLLGSSVTERGPHEQRPSQAMGAAIGCLQRRRREANLVPS